MRNRLLSTSVLRSKVWLGSLLLLLLLLLLNEVITQSSQSPSIDEPHNVSSSNTCFEDGTCYDLRTYITTSDIRSQFKEACGDWFGFGVYCDEYLHMAKTLFGRNNPYAPDYASMSMFVFLGVFNLPNNNLTLLQGQNVPLSFKVPMLLTASGLNLLAQNLTNQAFVDSVYVYSGAWTYSPRCPLSVDGPGSGSYINVTWTDWSYLSTSRAALVGLMFTNNFPEMGGTLSFIKRAFNLSEAQHPRGIGAYDWPVGGVKRGYAWQYEITMPPGIVKHSFYCEQRTWCLQSATNFTYPITIEYSYLLNSENDPLLNKDQEELLLKEMQDELSKQESMCWPFYCDCLHDQHDYSDQEPVRNSNCTESSYHNLHCPSFFPNR